MGFFNSISISASALTAQRLRMDTISQNIANVSTNRTEDGTPYRRKIVQFEEKSTNMSFADYLSSDSKEKFTGGGVRVARIIEDSTPFRKVYDPGHPDANTDGYVEMPNVDVVIEMVNMISATRAYEANVTCINDAKSMALKALEIGR